MSDFSFISQPTPEETYSFDLTSVELLDAFTSWANNQDREWLSKQPIEYASKLFIEFHTNAILVDDKKKTYLNKLHALFSPVKENLDLHFLINAGALFVINDSAGKDSQAMKIKLINMVPKRQLVIVHANLPEVEWDGNLEHIKKYAQEVPVFEVVGNKTFFEMVEHRKMFPSPKNRQCTSDLKRAPIQKFINNYALKGGFKYVVNCMGLRAEESSARAKKNRLEFKENNSAKHRLQYEYLPIHAMLIDEVWATISKAGQHRHYAYDKGANRLSCCFCIYSCESDIRLSAKLKPELAARYMEVEERLNFTLSMSQKSIRQIIETTPE